MTSPTDVLRAAIAARAAARERLYAEALRLDCARAAAESAQRECDRLDALESQWIGRHEKRIDAWVTDGGKGQPPALLADVKADTARRSAESALRAAAAVARRHADARAAAGAQLDAAERNVRGAALRAVTAEAEQLADQITCHEARAVALRERLLGLANDLDVPINQLHGGLSSCASGEKVRAALNPPAGLTVSRYSAMLLERGPHRERIGEAARAWRERLQALERGDGLEPAEPPATEAAA